MSSSDVKVKGSMSRSQQSTRSKQAGGFPSTEGRFVSFPIGEKLKNIPLEGLKQIILDNTSRQIPQDRIFSFSVFDFKDERKD